MQSQYLYKNIFIDKKKVLVDKIRMPLKGCESLVVKLNTHAPDYIQLLCSLYYNEPKLM